jgi:hypothetical protein
MVSRSTQWVTTVPWPPSPLGQVGVARVARAVRVAKGVRGATMTVPAQMGLRFQPTIPRLVCCNDFKGGSKARCSSSTNSSSVAISSAKNVTEHHAVALVSIRRVAPLGHPIFLRLPTCARGRGGQSGGLPLGAKGSLSRAEDLNHPGMVGDIISKRWAELSRNGGRHHVGTMGDITPSRPRYPWLPDLPSPPLSAQGAKGAQGAMPQPACRST